MKYKNYNVPDNEIDKLMEKLDISMAEACEIWLSDREMIENETIHELTEMARKNRITATIHEAKGEKKERKAREKKENLLKQSIINIIFNSFVKNLPDAENRGYGIYTSKNALIEGLGGSFLMVSGNAVYVKSKNGYRLVAFPELVRLNGTIVALRIPYQNPNFMMCNYWE